MINSFNHILFPVLTRFSRNSPLPAILLLLLFSHGIQTYSQVFSGIERYNTDSLLQLIPQKKGKELVDVYNRLAVSYAYYNPALCEKFTGKANLLAKKLDYSKGLADAERYKGQMLMYAGKYPDAVIHFYNSLDYYEQLEDHYSLAQLYFDLAKVHFYAGNYQNCEEYGLKSLELYQLKKADGTTLGSQWEIAKLKSAFGLLYRTTNRSEKAKEIYRWYNKIMNEQGYEITNRMVHTQILGRCFDETHDPDSALLFFRKSLEFPEANPSIKALRMESRLTIAMINYKQEKLNDAEQNFLLVAEEMGNAGFLRQAVQSNFMLGDIYQQYGNIRKAEEFYLKALKETGEMIKNLSYYRYDSLRYVVSIGSELYFPFPDNYIRSAIWKYQSNITGKLFQLYRQREMYKQSMEYMILNAQARDTLNALSNIRDLLELQTKYETSRKELQIKQLAEANKNQQLRLNQSWIMMAGMGILIVLLIVIGILWIRQGRIKTSQQMIILEQKLMRSQMNPHFIFNSMASIQDFILAKDPGSASRYLSRFARLIRNILDRSLEEMIPVSREIETIDNFLHLQKLRLEDKFDFEILVDKSINKEEIMLPAMLVQPFVENAIDHGIRFKSEKGNIIISFALNGPWLDIRVEDNGVGRKKAFELESNNRKDYTSVSTNLIRERLRILNKKTRQKISLEIIDLYNHEGIAAGTRVEIRIPVK